ncbi:hypothetical protein F2P56_003929 [Juglans regia]|uniref:Uncharacterized protein n=1 Tax=Juglans regia TaxID=51240 RepID=A0A834D127_JUGRE|nr:hypothetical protein F2P56_003929 [Juglans regia]
MAVSFKYWDDCIDPIDMGEMWSIPEVRTEWLDAGESREQKVHLSRDPDGQPYLTQTEMKAVAEIVVRRHFDSRIDLANQPKKATLMGTLLLQMLFQGKTMEEWIDITL